MGLCLFFLFFFIVFFILPKNPPSPIESVQSKTQTTNIPVQTPLSETQTEQTDEEINNEKTEKPSLRTSCNTDSDCVDVGGGSCSSGCSWVINKGDEEAAEVWIQSQAENDKGCYMDCPAYNPPVCLKGLCEVTEKSYE